MKLEQEIKPDRISESGNVLFLILIAVALFAALSYAVTQSTRSGSGESNSETSLINSAQLTQYPSGVRTALVRMIIGGTQADELLFNQPSDFGVGINTDDERSRSVFHPQGGGAVFADAPVEVMSTGTQGAWIFTGDYAIQNIGTTTNGVSTGNDVIAFLPNISGQVCRKINDQIGLDISGGTDADGDGVPVGGATTVPTIATNMLLDTKTPPFAVLDAAHTLDDAVFTGQPFGCYDSQDGGSTTDGFIYYHVLIER